VLRAASALFGTHGVDRTSMAQIAAASGLGASSLYYYFRNRDEIVAALVARANVVPLGLVTRITSDDRSAAAKLYKFVVGDVVALCALPFDINEIHRIAARERERFAVYWAERSRLERRLAALVRQGMGAGDLRTVDPRLTALTIMANDEGVQNWYRLGTSRRVDAIAKSVADLTIGGLLAPTHTLDEVSAESS
jgi:TetR/AcrR family transcriptional regulator